tara:strand:- start:155 stop:730 length:576 start_codon:yes stop_codon:yes gene_type:complete
VTLRRVTPPATDPITLEEAKDQCEVDYPDRDDYITRLIKTAVSFVDGEGILGRAMVSQTWAQWVGQSPGVVRITMGPFIDLTGVSYYDTDGALQVANAADFEVRLDGDFVNVRPKNGKAWPAAQSRDDAIKIEFTAGYGTAADVPDNIKHALLLMVGHWFKEREAASELSLKDIPMGVDALIGVERVGWYG